MSSAQWHHDQNMAAQMDAQDAARKAGENAARKENLSRMFASDANLLGSHGMHLGAVVNQSVRSPGKMFSRSDILAILRSERTKWIADTTEAGGIRYRAAMEALDAMQHIFQNLE